MARYAILDQPDRAMLRAWQKRAIQAGLRPVARIGTSLVVACPTLATSWQGDACLVLGQYVAHNRAPSELGVSHHGEVLRRGWGGYVAVCRNADQTTTLIRDPSAALPCYMYRGASGAVAASDVALIDQILGERLSLDWSGVEHCLRGGDLRIERTAVAGLTELLPGRAIDWSASRLRTELLWSPWDYIDRAAAASFDEQARAFEAIMLEVVQSISAGLESALVTVSGGLDSSIVTAALTRAGIPLTCLTLATRDPSGDERHYAAQLAEHLGARLITAFFDPDHVDLARSQAAHLPRPTGRPFAQSADRLIQKAALETDARAVFHGTGGDNICGFLQSAAPVADRLIADGVHAALATARDVANLNDVSVFQALRAGLVRSLTRRRRYRWRSNDRFLTAASPCDEAGRHEWLCAPEDASPGQIARVALLLRIQNYLEPGADNRLPSLLPFLTQPVVEYCLSVPSWRWCAGGRDRAVARRAFASHLPQAILSRRWKGGPDGFLGLLVEANRAVLLDRLCEGLLAARGLIDRPAVVSVLADPRPPSASDALRLLALADAEAWVRHRS